MGNGTALLTKIDEKKYTNGNVNKINHEDKTVHDWYRFVLSFPPHLVRHYINEFNLRSNNVILDPFCGTGTTLVEAKFSGIKSLGIESNPFAAFASKVKTNWYVDIKKFIEDSKKIAQKTNDILKKQNIYDDVITTEIPNGLNLREIDKDAGKLLIKNSISPLPLHKALFLLDCINENKNEDYYEHALLALGKALVFQISNLRFGPEVGLGKIKSDSPVISTWFEEVKKITSDLLQIPLQTHPSSLVLLGDSRDIKNILKNRKVDAVITSPPYPNEKDYTRTTRLESVILGFLKDRSELRCYKKTFIRSNTRGVYKGDTDEQWVESHKEIQKIARDIEKRRIELNKNSGFEKLYSTVTKLYFGGMYKHLEQLREVLNPGAQLAYVVGDQASYLRIMIRTGKILGEIAESLGYKLEKIDLFRTRFSTATKQHLREEVVVLRWPN